MYRETIRGKWEREPIFASSHAGGYFCHVFFNGEPAGTVRAEELGEGVWEAMVEDVDGETVHTMGYNYPTYHEAIMDMADWFTGQ